MPDIAASGRRKSQAELAHSDHCLRAVADAERLEYRRDMDFHGAFRELELAAYQLIWHSLDKQRQHLRLPLGEAYLVRIDRATEPEW